MPKHIFINSHDLDTSMIGAQLVNGKGRYIDIPGTCFGYKFEFAQLQRENMPELILDRISDDWLDAQNLVKYDSGPDARVIDEVLTHNQFHTSQDELNKLVSSGITEEDADILNGMPDGTYFWHTRHVSEMFMNIDKIENAHILQLVARNYEPYFKLLLQHQILEKGGEHFTSTIDALLEELVTCIHGTNNCAVSLVNDGFGEKITFCDYEVMYNADLFQKTIAFPLEIEVDVKRNKKVIADYLEENLGSVMHATDEEIDNMNWDNIDSGFQSIQSPVIKQEMKRSYLSDKKYFTEQNNTNQRTVNGYDLKNPRDWFDVQCSTMNEEFLDEEWYEMATDTLYRGNSSRPQSQEFYKFIT